MSETTNTTKKAKATDVRVEPITLTDSETGRKYILDFNLDSIAFIQQRGFDWELIVSQSAIMIPLIFWGAFRRYEKNVSKANTDKMLEDMGGLTTSMMVRLRELWEQALAPLVFDDSEGEEQTKNSKWTVEM